MSMLVYVLPLLYQIQSDPTKMIFEENTINIFKHRQKTTHQYFFFDSINFVVYLALIQFNCGFSVPTNHE